MRKVKTGGGWPAVIYTFRKAREAGGFLKLWKAMRSKNACKTCALGMGGQSGGMVNEGGHFPEVCKKSLQAMVADMQGAIRPDFFQTYATVQLERFTPRELESCGRLTTPQLCVRGSDYYRPIEWSEAFDRIVAKLKSVTPNETFWYFSGRSSNEAAFLLQLFARMYGTNNINNCSYYCHQASGVGLSTAIGSGTATVTLDDVEQSDLVFVIGGNPASNHPRLMRSLMGVRRRGGQVIVINPVIETGMVNFSVPSDVRSLLFGSPIASLYVQPHIGGDLALLSGVAKQLEATGAIDEPFLVNHCEGWSELKAHLRSLDWDEIVNKSGVSREEIDEIARRYAQAKTAVLSWTMGITHHAHGVQNVQAVANLALLRGMVGRPHSGLMPIRGHSNVQGIGSVGVSPQLKQAMFDRLQSHFGVRLPTDPGLDTLGCIDGAAAGQLKFGLCLGGNLFGASPDATYTRHALEQLELLVHVNTTLNTGHTQGLAAETILLPVLPRDEEPEPTTQESMFNFVRLSDGGKPRHVGPKSEVELVSTLAHRVLGADTPIDWQELSRTGRIREAIAAVVPGWEAIRDIAETKKEFHIPGRILHEPRFPTKSGRARLHVHSLPQLEGGPRELRLMTVRSEGQFNTVVYEEYDLYRGQDRRDIVLLHPDDIQALGLTADTRVRVYSAVGALDGILVRAFTQIKPGNALMYYPEANILVPRTLDPASKTPAFKGIPIRLEPVVTAGGSAQSGAPAGLHAVAALAENGDAEAMAARRSGMRAC
jgi:molybdopterin-dependent oxidoreductase alpha subunit